MRANGWKLFVFLALLAFITGCQSCNKSAEKKQNGNLAQPGAAKSVAGSVSAQANKPNDSVDDWNEFPPVVIRKVSYTSHHNFQAPPPAQPADADAIIDQYQKDCGNGASSESCQELRLQVEHIFLQDLVGLRDVGQKIDRKWYRIAAAASTPQLACLGVRELIYDENRTADDEALIVAALESPAEEVRQTVLSAETKLPAVKDAQLRAKNWSHQYTGACLGGHVDVDPGVKWAGKYPGARYRFFASSPSLRWFTTSDPVDKVIAYFNNSGRKAMTADELAADANAKLIAEMNKISMNPAPGNEQKIMKLMLAQTHQTNWMEPFRNYEQIGEIRFVMLTAKQAIAIFKDDALHATSIVAIRPKAPPETDIEKAKFHEKARSILGF